MVASFAPVISTTGRLLELRFFIVCRLKNPTSRAYETHRSVSIFTYEKNTEIAMWLGLYKYQSMANDRWQP